MITIEPNNLYDSVFQSSTGTICVMLQLLVTWWVREQCSCNSHWTRRAGLIQVLSDRIIPPGVNIHAFN